MGNHTENWKLCTDNKLGHVQMQAKIILSEWFNGLLYSK